MSADIETIDVAGLQEAAGKPDVHILDVRLPFDFLGGRIPGSKNLPREMIRERVGQLPAGARLVFVADDEGDSAEAAAAAREVGFTNVAVLAGGVDAWFDADLPMETASDGVAQG